MRNDSYLAHYASKYYDPVKAHEYYEKHKQLKGRQSTANLNDKGKKVWASVKNEITAEKKETLSEENAKHKASIEQLRSRASDSKKAITEKLKAYVSQLKDQTSSHLETERNTRDAKIKQIQNEVIPTGISKYERLKRVADKRKRIEQIRGDSDNKTERLKTDYKTKIDDGRQNSNSDRTAVANQLKEAVEAARQKYQANKASINAKYEKVYQDEYDKVASSYRKVGKKKTSK